MALLSVIIPAYNEEGRLGPSLVRILSFLKSRRIRHEVLVVDDGSKDSTAKLVKRLAKGRAKTLKLICQGTNMGKGAAVKAGVERASGSVILFSDADLSTPIEELPRLMDRLEQGYDIVIGSRALERERITRHQPFYREVGGRLFNVLVRLLTLPGIRDTQCGFKLFQAGAAKRIFALQQVPRFGFDVEALFLARKFGYRVSECPVAWENSPESKVRPVADGLRTFLDLALIRGYDWAGRYR